MYKSVQNLPLGKQVPPCMKISLSVLYKFLHQISGQLLNIMLMCRRKLMYTCYHGPLIFIAASCIVTLALEFTRWLLYPIELDGRYIRSKSNFPCFACSFSQFLTYFRFDGWRNVLYLVSAAIRKMLLEIENKLCLDFLELYVLIS